ILRLKALAAIASFVLLTLNNGARTQKSEKSVDTSPAWNDNSLIAVQKKGGDPTRPGGVKIEFYEHDAVERPKGLMVLERFVGQFKLGDIAITGLADKHQCEPTPADKQDNASADFPLETCPPNNVIAFDNAIQIIETGGLRIAVWGDNRVSPNPFLDHYLRNVDVLILPVESVLTRSEVDAIVGKYDPKTVIPAHYYVTGLTTNASGLDSADGWVNYQEKVHHADVRRLDRADVTLNAAELKGAHH